MESGCGRQKVAREREGRRERERERERERIVHIIIPTF